MSETTLAAANMQVEQDKKRNLNRILEFIQEAATSRVDVLVLPEVGLQGYPDLGLPGTASADPKARVEQKKYYHYMSETIPGPSTEAIEHLARRHDMYVQLGLAESALDGNVVYNSTALIGPNGVVGVYRKTHNAFEVPYFGTGSDIPVFETSHGRIGSLICYDLAFPEPMRVCALKGANVVLLSTAWPMDGHDRSVDANGQAMDLCARANSLFNQTWLVVSNHCETGAHSAGLDYWGGSQIVDPNSNVVAYLSDGEGLVVHTADLREVALEARTSGFYGMNLLQDRRPELYGVLADDWYRHPSISNQSTAIDRS